MDLQISGKQMWTGSDPQIALQIALSSSNEGKQTATTHNSVDEFHNQLQRGLYFIYDSIHLKFSDNKNHPWC